MRRVAFLSFDWDYEVVSEYYRGMQAYLADRSDVQLVIFSAFGHYYASYEPDAGSYEVFTLCNMEEYDGIILQGNRTWPPPMREQVAKRASVLGKPVVSINYELESAHYVGTNNYDAMYGLVHKVLTDRGCNKVAFVNGLATSVEAQARARAYVDACASLGVADARFYQANWQIEEGVATALRLLERADDLPEVVFCCNDDLAVGLQETLQEHGVRVPEDIMVTGFDNREISLRTMPRITTVDRDYFTLGQTALDTAIRLIDGEELPRKVWSAVRYIVSESCRYVVEQRESIVGELYTLDNSLKRFYEVVSRFQFSVLTSETIGEIMDVCEEYYLQMRCDNVYLCLNDRYLTYDADCDTATYGPVSHLMAMGGERPLGPCDSSHTYRTYLTEELLPRELGMDKPLYVVYPLRHGPQCIGMMVTEGLSPVMQHGFLTFFITMLSGSISSVRKNELLQAANMRLDHLYVHDELTGLFNRFGLDRIGNVTYELLLREYGEAQLIFVDVDNMKTINDMYGHEMGDQALRDSADIIRRATRNQNAFAMRYGGDEFLLICRNNLIPRIERELQLLHGSRSFPYILNLSMGSFCVHAQDDVTLASAIEQADARMYANKKARKALTD